MRKLKIHLKYEYGLDGLPYSSAHIRLLCPLSHPANQDALEIVSSDQADFQGVDVVIVERLWRPDISVKLAEELVRRVRRTGACLIYTADDNLLDRYDLFPPHGNAAGALFAREADGIIVSTRAMKERLSPLNPTILVVPNATDERLFAPGLARPWGKATGRRLVIGYMGTYTHDGDLAMIRGALREVLRKRRQSVELVITGAFWNEGRIRELPPAWCKGRFAGLPVRALPVAPGCDQYPRFVPWMIENLHFDVGIAPLQDSPFTRCKSDLKALDYGALGIPGIYSRVGPYETTVRHLETGYLAENTPTAWQEGLERLLDDESLRRSIAENARDYVISQRTLAHRARDWQEAIFAIRDGCRDTVRSACGSHSEPNPTGAAENVAVASVHRYPRGSGLAGACDAGIAMSRAKYLVLLAADAALPPRWLQRLVQIAEDDPTVAMVVPLSNHGGELSLPRPPGMSFVALDKRLQQPPRVEPFDVVAATGPCLLLRREALRRHGGFDPALGPGGCEAADLQMRLASYGWRSVAAPNVYVEGRGSGLAAFSEASKEQAALFRARWGARYDCEIARVRAADPLKPLRVRLGLETIAAGPVAARVPRRDPAHALATLSLRTARFLVRNRGKLLTIAFQPRRAVAAVRRRLPLLWSLLESRQR